MNELEIITRLNENQNFHLSLKCIQITDDKIIEDILKENKTEKIMAIKDLNSAYENLLKAHKENFGLVIVNENIRFLLPQYIVLTKENLEILQPMIPVYYLLKDNKVIQKIKTHCHKTSTMFYQIKSIDDIQQLIKKSKSNT